MRMLLCLAMLLGSCLTAGADWIYSGKKSAFGGVGTHFTAISNDDDYALGFRCDQEVVSTVYVTSQRMSHADVAVLQSRGELLVRVDENPVERALAVPDSTGEKLRLTATFPYGLLEAVQNAQTRIAVAVWLDSEVLLETSFSVRGSTSAMKQFIEACPTAKPPA